MITLNSTIKLWKQGKIKEAYNMFKADEGSLNIGYSFFCAYFGDVVKKHDENMVNEENHAKAMENIA